MRSVRPLCWLRLVLACGRGVDIQKTAMDEVIAAKELVTKADLVESLANQKVELIKWMVSLVAAQTALLIAVMAFIK